jgi:hypothetical protein
MSHAAPHPVDVHVEPALDRRDRLTAAFRLILALPHLALVGGPLAAGLTWTWRAILFTGRMPGALHRFGVGVLRWGTRVEAYLPLLHDEYPPLSLT